MATQKKPRVARKPIKYPHDLLRPEDITREYRIGTNRVRELARAGAIQHLTNGRRILIPRHCFEAWMDSNLSEPLEPEPIAPKSKPKPNPSARSFPREYDPVEDL